jgi:hypothetical protein
MILSFITSVVAAYVLLAWAYQQIPGRGPLSKGFLFGLVLLVLSRQFLADHFILILHERPIWFALLNQASAWVFVFALSISLAWFVARRQRFVTAAHGRGAA